MAVNEFKSGRFAALALVLLLATESNAMQQQIRFERISVEQGLSHPDVTAIIQDRSGFMWIGTADGLNRYDGYNFIVYRHDPGDPNSISDNEIRGIAEDEFGNLWVGTRAGLNRLNRGAGTLQSVTSSNVSSGTANRSVTASCPSGYVVTGGGFHGHNTDIVTNQQSGNSWFVFAFSQTRLVAIATCTRLQP